MNLTYSQLLAELIALNLHPLAETNVHTVTSDRGAAVLDFDTSEVCAIKADFYQAEKDCDELQQENSKSPNVSDASADYARRVRNLYNGQHD